MKFFTRLLFSVLPLVVVAPVVGIVLTLLRADAIVQLVDSRNAELELESFLSRCRDEYAVLERLNLTGVDFYSQNAQRSVIAYASERTIPGAALTIDRTDGMTVVPPPEGFTVALEREAIFEPWEWRIAVVVSEEHSHRFLRESSRFLVALVALMVVPLVGILLLLARRFSAPIEELERSAAALARGDLSVRAAVVGRGEIGSLARTFNRMATNLETLTFDLESQVAARTDELQASLQELKDTQDQLIRRERMAALGSLVAGIAHEINTPIGIGVTSSTFLKSISDDMDARLAAGDLSDEEVARYVRDTAESAKIIYRSLNRAQELIGAFKQLAVDQTAGQVRTFAFPDYFRDIVISLEPRLKRTSVEITVECPTRIHVEGKPGLFYQIFTNLIFNSLIHGFRESDAGRITVRFHASGNDLVIEYRDDGVGMSSEHAARVFDPFFTTRLGQGGSGLGMHIVYNIVTETLGGSIDLETAPGQGARFTISVPGLVRSNE